MRFATIFQIPIAVILMLPHVWCSVSTVVLVKACSTSIGIYPAKTSPVGTTTAHLTITSTTTVISTSTPSTTVYPAPTTITSKSTQFVTSTKILANTNIATFTTTVRRLPTSLLNAETRIHKMSLETPTPSMDARTQVYFRTQVSLLRHSTDHRYIRCYDHEYLHFEYNDHRDRHGNKHSKNYSPYLARLYSSILRRLSEEASSSSNSSTP